MGSIDIVLDYSSIGAIDIASNYELIGVIDATLDYDIMEVHDTNMVNVITIISIKDDKLLLPPREVRIQQ